ncbi:E3 ubiquitin-protein ligase [Aspergillus foveolatus]|uniref:E3 ubiquitin-protein ligase n=1 Tax=Aspergillus foveolatus TaxID=210207 RepID=UPI003CCE1CC5
MRKFVKFLGGEKNGGSYHSIWAMPAPESGTRAVVTNTKKEKARETREILSTKKPQSTLHISKLNQLSEAELSSPTTSTVSAPTDQEPVVVELPAVSEAQVSELDCWSPTGQTGVPTEVRKETDGEGASVNSTSRPITGPDADILIFSDETDGIPMFGRQFGIAPTSIIRERKVKEPEHEPVTQPGPEPNTSPKSPETFLQQVDEELEALYTDYLKSSGKQRVPERTKTVKKARKSGPRPKEEPEACIICLEPFSADVVKAPDTLSIACQHTPSVCYICLSKSIKHDLETKFWDEIKCPQCQTLFIHEDIKRFADEEAFTRYDRLSLRHALNADKNFIWCLECDFGQLHKPGAEQPLVICYNCSAQSCFKHAIKWHDGFSCDEYDAVLWDPDSYRAIKAKNGGSTRPNVEYLSKKNMQRAKNKEQRRQYKMHEAQKTAARKRQEEEAARVREKKALEQAQAEAAQEEEEEDEEPIEEEVKDDFKEKIEMLKWRMREVELSMKKVEETTKRCPGCQWPIEKNDGCDHMTCIKCRAEFCWICLGGWSSHTRRCRRPV